MNRHGRATVNPAHPEAFAICDRCGTQYNHSNLNWQFEWHGPMLGNTGFLVCHRCMDKPFIFFKPILLGPDPIPIKNPRPPFWWQEAEASPTLVTDDGAQIVTNDDEEIQTSDGLEE